MTEAEQLSWDSMIRYRDCIQWDETQIGGFFGEYRWLSNFHKCTVPFCGIDWPSSEHAYQWSKVPYPNALSKDVVDHVLKLTTPQVKKWGRTCNLRSDWDDDKLETMHDILVSKFKHNPDLMQKLVDTDSRILIETNSWGDKFWGKTLDGEGTNHLGKQLMQIRELEKFERLFTNPEPQ